MSQSIAIPGRGDQSTTPHLGISSTASTSSNITRGFSRDTSCGSSPSSSVSPTSLSPFGSTKDKGKGKGRMRDERRANFLSSSISRCEHTVVNIGDPDGPPRLITCVKASQGFDWNQDIFFPSYVAEHDYGNNLEHRPDPVQEIILTEEEAEGIFPDSFD